MHQMPFLMSEEFVSLLLHSNQEQCVPGIFRAYLLVIL